MADDEEPTPEEVYTEAAKALTAEAVANAYVGDSFDAGRYAAEMATDDGFRAAIDRAYRAGRDTERQRADNLVVQRNEAREALLRWRIEVEALTGNLLRLNELNQGRLAVAQATIDRVEAIAEKYKAEWLDNNGGQHFSDCYSDLRAALDGPPGAESDSAFGAL